MNEQKHFQERFFQYLSNRKTSEVVLHDTMEVLNIRKGATYKRMNGETALTTAELMRLASHFNVSLDTALGNDPFLSFVHPFLSTKTSDDFLDRFSFYLKPLANPGESKLTYLANELPVFYYFSHEYIFNFLFSVWNHLHRDESQLYITKNAHIDAKLHKVRNEVTNYYNGHPVTEIWNSNMFANLYQQIIFSITIRAFAEQSYIEYLVKDIEKLIKHLRDLALTGKKKTTGSNETTELKIYLNEFGTYMNMVLYQSENFSASFVGFDIPQFIVSHNDNFAQFADNWVDKIRKRSVLISSEGYQYRELFFIKMENDFKMFKERVDKMVGVYYQ